MKRHVNCAEQQLSRSNLNKYCACHAKWLPCLILVTYSHLKRHLQVSPSNLPKYCASRAKWLDPRHKPVIVKFNTPTSPNIAPATTCDAWSSHALSSSHLKRHLHCAEQQRSGSNLTKYCACHEKWQGKISEKMPGNKWYVIYNAGTVRPWSENDPIMIRAWNRQSATRLATEVTFRARRESFLLKKTFRAPAIIETFSLYQVLRRP